MQAMWAARDDLGKWGWRVASVTSIAVKCPQFTKGGARRARIDPMKYAYEDLSDDQFEGLVVVICRQLFGVSVQGFAKGPDGGRDAKFVGTAELHPSKASPWIGTTIIQAKHTNGYNCTFSDSDFFSPKANNTVIGKEVPRIKRLRANGELDHYILFSNRRLAGNSESTIRRHLCQECGVPIGSIYLCGVEQLEAWMKVFPQVARLAELDPVDCPLIVTPDDLAEVVCALALRKADVIETFDDPPTNRVTYELKNATNNMTPEYAKAIRDRYLKDTRQIEAFLAAPENDGLLGLYQSVVDEIELKVIANRKQHQTFDKVMEYLAHLLFNRDPVLRKHKRLTRAVLFYMYWHCDIGQIAEGENVAAN